MALALANNTGYKWNLPPGFPTPNVPADNPMTVEKVKLGRFLFYDKKSRRYVRKIVSLSLTIGGKL